MTKEVRSLEHENITSSCCVCVWLGVGGGGGGGVDERSGHWALNLLHRE